VTRVVATAVKKAVKRGDRDQPAATYPTRGNLTAFDRGSQGLAVNAETLGSLDKCDGFCSRINGRGHRALHGPSAETSPTPGS
jgi:hypothetical protein